jgi:hypothetical protein
MKQKRLSLFFRNKTALLNLEHFFSGSRAIFLHGLPPHGPWPRNEEVRNQTESDLVALTRAIYMRSSRSLLPLPFLVPFTQPALSPAPLPYARRPGLRRRRAPARYPHPLSSLPSIVRNRAPKPK